MAQSKNENEIISKFLVLVKVFDEDVKLENNGMVVEEVGERSSKNKKIEREREREIWKYR